MNINLGSWKFTRRTPHTLRDDISNYTVSSNLDYKVLKFIASQTFEFRPKQDGCKMKPNLATMFASIYRTGFLCTFQLMTVTRSCTRANAENPSKLTDQIWKHWLWREQSQQSSKRPARLSSRSHPKPTSHDTKCVASY